MLYLLRYEDELRDPKSVLAGVKNHLYGPMNSPWQTTDSRKHVEVRSLRLQK